MAYGRETAHCAFLPEVDRECRCACRGKTLVDAVAVRAQRVRHAEVENAAQADQPFVTAACADVGHDRSPIRSDSSTPTESASHVVRTAAAIVLMLRFPSDALLR